MEKNKLYARAEEAFKLVKTARDTAIDTLAGIVKDAGGFIATLPSEDKPRLTAYQDLGGDELEMVTVFGLRVDDEGELYLCTSDNVANYEYEHDFNFEYLSDFADEDLEQAKKMLSNLKNFSSIWDDDFVRSATIFSILAGLMDYL